MTRLPKLQPSNRNREFLERSEVERAKIVESWLMFGQLSHRAMDDLLLGFDSRETRGWKSMGVLAYLGLKKEFKGFFSGVSYDKAIGILMEDNQNFELVITYLSLSKSSYKSALDELSETVISEARRRDARILRELDATDGVLTSQNFYRREQAFLRELMLAGKNNVKCSLCHRQVPADLIFAAHIKPRHISSHKERTTPEIVMPLCKLGCDDLYEKGYLIVDREGTICLGKKNDVTKDLSQFLGFLVGKKCLNFNDDTKSFFEARTRFLGIKID